MGSSGGARSGRRSECRVTRDGRLGGGDKYHLLGNDGFRPRNSPGTGVPAPRREREEPMTGTSLYGGVTTRRVTIRDLQAAKERGERWPMLTAYDYSTARVFDEAGIPVLLVGDSAANVVYGYDTTVPVSVDELLPLVRGVVRGAKRALVVGDLPFGSYQTSPAQALETATRFMKDGGCQAIKLEGGQRVAAAGRGAHIGRHPGHGAHRADAPVGERARRVPRAGPRRRGGAPADPGREGDAAGRRVRGGPRGGAVRPGRPGDQDAAHPDHRDRRRPGHRCAGAGLAGHGRATR